MSYNAIFVHVAVPVVYKVISVTSMANNISGKLKVCNTGGSKIVLFLCPQGTVLLSRNY